MGSENTSKIYVLNFSSELNETFILNDSNGIDYNEIGRLIQIIARPILIVFGTVLNILSFIVMRRGSLKTVSTCFYMSILALADIGVLWTGAFISWIGHLTRWRVNADTFTDCKFNYFIYFFFRHFSSSLLVMMTVEKCLALYLPFKAKSLCTVGIAKRAVLLAAFGVAVFNSQQFFTARAAKDSSGYGYCEIYNVPEGYIAIFLRVDSTLYSFAPFAIMICANVAIMFKFIKAKCKPNPEGAGSTNQALSKSATKGIAVVVTVSVTFIVLTGPLAITYAITYDVHPIVDAVIYILQYSNHSINGVLYCVVGSRFRNELMNLLCCRQLSHHNSSCTLNSSSSENRGSVYVIKPTKRDQP